MPTQTHTALSQKREEIKHLFYVTKNWPHLKQITIQRWYKESYLPASGKVTSKAMTTLTGELSHFYWTMPLNLCTLYLHPSCQTMARIHPKMADKCLSTDSPHPCPSSPPSLFLSLLFLTHTHTFINTRTHTYKHTTTTTTTTTTHMHKNIHTHTWTHRHTHTHKHTHTHTHMCTNTHTRARVHKHTCTHTHTHTHIHTLSATTLPFFLKRKGDKRYVGHWPSQECVATADCQKSLWLHVESELACCLWSKSAHHCLQNCTNTQTIHNFQTAHSLNTHGEQSQAHQLSTNTLSEQSQTHQQSTKAEIVADICEL